MKLRECSLTGVVRVAALASVSSPPVSSWRPCLCCPDQLAPSPLLANTGAGGGGQHGPCLLQEVGTTVPHTHLPLDTQFRISHDVCRQAARARRPRGRAAERSLLFVRFKVGGSQVSAGCGRLEPRNKGAGERFGDSHEVNEQSSRFLQIALLMIQNAKYY